MPWTKSDYPYSMKNLPAEVRNKAIEIANVLLEERHMEEGIAIATGISRAKDWAAAHGKPTEAPEGISKKTDVKIHGEDRYVIPQEKGWAVKKEKGKEELYNTKKEAIAAAKAAAKSANATVTIQGKDGKIQSRQSFNPNRKAPKT
jgi:uncharacterized protein YdaT